MYVLNSFVGARNSQSREQMQLTLDKLGSSLCQKNYFNFVRYVNTFFAIWNIIIINKIVNSRVYKEELNKSNKIKV